MLYTWLSRSKSKKRRLVGISRSKSEKRTLCQRHRILEFPRDISRWYMPHTVCCLTFCGIIGMSHREESCKVRKSDYRWYICQRWFALMVFYEYLPLVYTAHSPDCLTFCGIPSVWQGVCFGFLTADGIITNIYAWVYADKILIFIVIRYNMPGCGFVRFHKKSSM